MSTGMPLREHIYIYEWKSCCSSSFDINEKPNKVNNSYLNFIYVKVKELTWVQQWEHDSLKKILNSSSGLSYLVQLKYLKEE